MFFLKSHTMPHNDKVKRFFVPITNFHKYSEPLLSTLLKHLWQRLQPRVFLGMTLQAWHTCIWGLSPILLCRSSQALSDWERRCTAIYRSPEMFELWLGHSRTFRDLSQSHSCVDVLLEGEHLSQSEVLSALEQGSIKDLCTLLRSSFPRS